MIGNTGTNGTRKPRSRSGRVRRRMITPMFAIDEREQRADVDELGDLLERHERRDDRDQDAERRR